MEKRENKLCIFMFSVNWEALGFLRKGGGGKWLNRVGVGRCESWVFLGKKEVVGEVAKNHGINLMHKRSKLAMGKFF